MGDQNLSCKMSKIMKNKKKSDAVINFTVFYLFCPVCNVTYEKKGLQKKSSFQLICSQ